MPLARIWLLDGYNLLHAILLGGRERQRWWQADERARLEARARAFSQACDEIWLAFDGPHEREGQEDPNTPDRLRIVFAPSADAWLTRRVRQAPQPEQVAVVTGDRQLAGRCRHAGAFVVAPRDFMAHCGADTAPAA